MTTKLPVIEFTYEVSLPYHVVGYHGGNYGTSQWVHRDYNAICPVDGCGVVFRQTTKDEAKRIATSHLYRVHSASAKLVFHTEGK